jgi:hypothetical protein
MQVIGTAREGQWASQCRGIQRPEWGGGHVSASSWEGQIDCMHGTADTCALQECSAPVRGESFRGLFGAMGTGMHIAAEVRKVVDM